MSAAAKKMAPGALQYLGAAVLSLIGLVVALLFRGLRGVPDGLVFAATIALTARFYGLGPSLFASALSVVAIDLTILPPIGRIELTHPEEITYSAVFVVLSLVISGTTHSLRLARAEAERLASRANRLLVVTTALSEAQLPADVAHVVVGQGFDVLEAVAGFIAVVDGDTIRMLDRRRSPRATSEPSPRLSLDDDTPLAGALRRREPVWLESPEQYRERFPRAAELFPSERAASAVLALPLQYGETLVGGLVLGFDQTTALGATDHALARLLAQAVGSALARAMTLERERHGRRDAEMLSRAREEVLGVVAHDLRNPLSVTAAVLQMLGDDGLPSPDRERLIDSGKRSVKQMNRLIGDLLDVMRMEAGRLALESEDLTVTSILTQAEEGARHLAAARRIALTVPPPDASLRLRGDRGRLAQVFGNLLGNAIKFTPEGGKVSLRAWRDGNEIVFEVADTGPGVPPEHLTHLFDRFWQANKADRRGVGLGLPIAKGIVDAHAGRMWVDSSVGKGSRFCVALPALA
jgi:K+-sensing histidine kinase KdpD